MSSSDFIPCENSFITWAGKLYRWVILFLITLVSISLGFFLVFFVFSMMAGTASKVIDDIDLSSVGFLKASIISVVWSVIILILYDLRIKARSLSYSRCFKFSFLSYFILMLAIFLLSVFWDVFYNKNYNFFSADFYVEKIYDAVLLLIVLGGVLSLLNLIVVVPLLFKGYYFFDGKLLKAKANTYK